LKYFLIKIALILFLISNIKAADLLLQPYNLNFEIGAEGNVPKGWYITLANEEIGFKAVNQTSDALEGTKCLSFSSSGELDPDANNGLVFQSIHAQNYRGKNIIFKAAFNTQELKDTAVCRLWLSFVSESNTEPIYKFSRDITKKSGWNYDSLLLKVDDNISVINFGIMLIGNGTILVDDVSFDFNQQHKDFIINDNTPLSNQELVNQYAFAKIFGYVRYFYPGFEARDENWNEFALKGVQAVEKAKNDDELKNTLNKLFLPVAPGLKFYKNNDLVPEKIIKPKEALDFVALSWLHIGANVGLDIKYFSSEIKNIYIPTRRREAPAIQIINATPLRGKKVRFSAYVKTNLYPPDGQAQLWLAADRGDDKIAVMETSANNPIVSKSWEKYSIEADIPKDASIIRLALVMLGDGKIWFDNPELNIVDNGKTTDSNYIRNHGFEEQIKTDIVLGWTLPEGSNNAGYLFKISDTEKYQGENSLLIFSDENTRITMPKLGETVEIQLNDSLKALMPLTVFTDSSTTLPKPPKDIETLNPFKPGDFVMTAEDRYSRLAITTILWNIYRHFAIGVNDNTDWDNILFKALSSATQNNNENQFIRTLNIMSASVNDGQSRVWSRESEFIYGLPIIWKYIGDKLVISKTFDKSSKIKIGSEIISINDISLNQLISKEMLAISANTEEWKKLRAASALKAGPYNQSVKLKVLSPEGIEEEHIIYKNTPLVDMIEDKPPYFEILDENQYYFDLTRLTDRGFKNIINDMKDKIASAKHIIFDLRGLSSMSTDFLGLFMELGVTAVSREIPVFSKPGGKPCTYYKINEEITAKNPKINASLFFLIDERTTGNAEIIAAFAKHYDIGKLIGSKTSGNADEVIGIKLPGEFAASIVGMKTTILGSNLVLKNGIKPDVNVNISVKGIAEGKDEVLEAAFKLLKK
jgi:C-terminal processing protease CtpA/Prc